MGKLLFPRIFDCFDLHDRLKRSKLCSKYMSSLTRKHDCKNWIANITLPDGTRTSRSTGTDDKKVAQTRYALSLNAPSYGMVSETRG